MSESWVRRATEAADGGEVAETDLRLEGAAPPLGSALSPLLTAPMLAAIAWAAAVLREQLAGSPIDPVAILIRVVAVAFTVRALATLLRLGPQLRLALTATAHRLVITPEGLLYRSPSADHVLPKPAVAAVVAKTVEGQSPWLAWSRPGRAERLAPGLRRHRRPGLLLASHAAAGVSVRQRRAPRRAPPAVARRPALPRDADVASAPRRRPGVLRPGRAARRSGRHGGPGARSGLAVGRPGRAGGGGGRGHRGPDPGRRLDHRPPVGPRGPPRRPARHPDALVPPQYRDVSPQQGLSMVLSPPSLLIRAPRTLVSTAWPSLLRVDLDEQRTWTVLEGSTARRLLVIRRADDAAIRYQERYLGVPAEVARALLSAYMRKQLPASLAESEAQPAEADRQGAP